TVVLPYSLVSPPSSLTIFLARLTVVLGAGASAFFAAGFLSPSALGRAAPRLAPAFGAGFLARLGSAGASGAGAAGAAAPEAAPVSKADASFLAMASPLYTQTLMPITP